MEKPGGTGRPRKAHFREIGALAAEQILHRSAAFGLLRTEGIDPFRHQPPPEIGPPFDAQASSGPWRRNFPRGCRVRTRRRRNRLRPSRSRRVRFMTTINPTKKFARSPGGPATRLKLRGFSAPATAVGDRSAPVQRRGLRLNPKAAQSDSMKQQVDARAGFRARKRSPTANGRR